MTKQNKTPKKKFTPKPKLAELAGQLDEEFKKHVKVTLLKNGAVGYKDFVIKQNKKENWCIYHVKNFQDMIGEFKLKTCALLAAKAYSTTSINHYFEIQDLDNRYWASHSDMQVYKRIIKKPISLDRYIIILNKLEDSELKERDLKRKITSLFHMSFA